MLPEKNTLPETVYSMRKLLKPFDLGYEKIHACPNDCCLFRKDLKDLDRCPKCGSSRWKVDKVTTKVRKGVPEKVLRYFPVLPRLKRMFKSKEKAEEMIWHSNHKSQDNMMCHPVDSVAWDTINHKWPNFASDPRNLRLGLATDGFNPFGDLSSRYSCWPVILVNYNLPPLTCMTKENLMLTLLIPGPKQPGNDIDVYLEPLVEDLKELWDKGVEAYDAFNKSMFNLKVILMWAINDFPAYGNLVGCATKGKLGCPICGEDICSMWLKYSRKFAYLGHRRFLSPNHLLREKKKWFNGKKERGRKVRHLNGLEIVNATKDIENDWGKKKNSDTVNTSSRKRKKQDNSKELRKPVQMWKKKSIFFDLPYWSEKTTQGDTKITRSQVWIEGHKKKNGEPITEAVGEKMKQIQECPPESQNTTNIADDAIRLVFGKETRGRVRGMGFGVTPSKVGAYVQQNGTVKQLQDMVHNLQQEMQEMKSMFLQSMRQQNQQEHVASGGIDSGIGNEVGSNNDINIGAKKICNFDNVKHLTTAQSNLKNVSCGDICPNSKCKLLHWSVYGLVVAEGRIASTDPNTKVHHVVLGRSCWKVWIDKVLVEKVDLIRPNDEMQFLDDAIGSTVAWLSKFVVLCD
ncbi:uncharacterized protein LOC142549251 [Primulina tabacum]|uniref:uncharacterized protein LOC142549251 n=1 Tax=Primulina tabacum TaxID=48773 RepID=UPI003F59AC60